VIFPLAVGDTAPQSGNNIRGPISLGNIMKKQRSQRVAAYAAHLGGMRLNYFVSSTYDSEMGVVVIWVDRNLPLYSTMSP
jgi:hypothetical protein